MLISLTPAQHTLNDDFDVMSISLVVNINVGVAVNAVIVTVVVIVVSPGFIIILNPKA